jgi:hypothetical protein
MDMGGVSVGGDMNGGFDTALIEGNVIYNCPNPIAVISQSGTQTALTKNVTIRDNVVYSNFEMDTIPSFRGTITVDRIPSSNVKIYNNTIFNNRELGGDNAKNTAIFVSSTQATDLLIKNNIMYNDKATIALLYFMNSGVHSGADIDNNIYIDKGNGAYIRVGDTNFSSLAAYRSAYPSKEQHGAQGTLQLVDPFNAVQSKRDFRLRSTDTLAIDKGAFVGTNEDDLLGIARGDTPDIGAYQYGNPPAPPMLYQ